MGQVFEVFQTIAYIVSVLFHFFVLALAVFFIFIPLGFFVMLGVDKRVLLLNSGFRVEAGVLLVLYHLVGGLLYWRSFRLNNNRKFRAARWYLATYWTMWTVGLAGLIRVVLNPM